MNAPPNQPPGPYQPMPGTSAQPAPGYAPQPVYVQPQPMQPGQPMQPMQQPQGPYYPAPPKKDETMALVARLLAIPAIIVGFMARNKIKADPERFGGDGLAKAGIIVGFVNLGLWILIAAVTVLSILVPFCLACVGVGIGALGG